MAACMVLFGVSCVCMWSLGNDRLQEARVRGYLCVVRVSLDLWLVDSCTFVGPLGAGVVEFELEECLLRFHRWRRISGGHLRRF